MHLVNWVMDEPKGKLWISSACSHNSLQVKPYTLHQTMDCSTNTNRAFSKYPSCWNVSPQYTNAHLATVSSTHTMSRAFPASFPASPPRSVPFGPKRRGDTLRASSLVIVPRTDDGTPPQIVLPALGAWKGITPRRSVNVARGCVGFIL